MKESIWRVVRHSKDDSYPESLDYETHRVERCDRPMFYDEKRLAVGILHIDNREGCEEFIYNLERIDHIAFAKHLLTGATSEVQGETVDTIELINSILGLFDPNVSA